MRSLVLLVVLSAATAAHASPPDGFVIRASPGFGVGWDEADRCPLDGRMFVGGFSGEVEVAKHFFIGAATTVAFNQLETGACASTSGTRMATGFVIGPSFEWYPTEHGLHVFALAGYASFEPSSEEDTSRGFGGTVGVGWDWRLEREPRGFVAGVRLQVTTARLSDEHAWLVPALVGTFGFD
jgi:hypothetical protein